MRGPYAVKVRRSPSVADLSELPLDGSDMHLLSCLDGEMSVSQLALVVGHMTPDEALRCVSALQELGVVELVDERTSTRPDDMVTMRPPPGTTLDPDSRETLRAPPMDSLLMRATPKASLALDAWFQAEPTEHLLKLLDPEGEGLFDVEDPVEPGDG